MNEIPTTLTTAIKTVLIAVLVLSCCWGLPRRSERCGQTVTLPSDRHRNLDVWIFPSCNLSQKEDYDRTTPSLHCKTVVLASVFGVTVFRQRIKIRHWLSFLKDTHSSNRSLRKTHEKFSKKTTRKFVLQTAKKSVIITLGVVVRVLCVCCCADAAYHSNLRGTASKETNLKSEKQQGQTEASPQQQPTGCGR